MMAEGKLSYGASAKIISQSPGKDIIKLVPIKRRYREKLWILPAAEHLIGFDIQINDDDNGDARDENTDKEKTIDKTAFQYPQ